MNTSIIICISIFIGAFYAFLLYSKKAAWSKKTNISIAILRLISVAIISFVVLGPFLKSRQTIIEKSTFVIAIDNSTSVKDALKTNVEALKQNIESLKGELENKFDIQIFTLDGSFNKPLSELKFNKKESDIVAMLGFVSNSLESSEIKGMLLLTDGIANKGESPSYFGYNYPVFTVGIGDTSVPKDVIIKNCLFNNIVGKNNRFPINVELKAFGFKGKKVNISIYSGKNKLQNKTVDISSNSFTSAISFECIEKEAGLKHYTIIAQSLAGEFSIKNNQKDIYFDVIEAKQKIALLAAAPHPDIKAIVSSLVTNENIEVKSFIEGIDEFTTTDKYDLIIAYQLPVSNSNFNRHIQTFIKDNTSILFILGGTTNVNEVNQLIPNLKILAQIGQFDKVSGILNPAFSRINFNPSLSVFLDRSPPLVVPFGEYNLGSGWDAMLYQKIGSLATEKPLLAVYAGEGKSYGILFGEGIWQWRMNESAENRNNLVFDDLLKKVTTLLAQKTDKRKFRCTTLEKNFEENLPVDFKIEAYNDIYEPVFGQEIDFQIRNDNGSTFNYKFKTSIENPDFELTGLKPGVYSYVSKTILAGKEQTAKGEFSIQDINLEDLSHVADFELLRNISNQTKGSFYTLAQMKQATTDLNLLEANEKVYQTESILEIINFKFLFFVVLLLLTFEWVIRKNLGQL